MRIEDLLRDPEAMQHLRSRACGDAGVPLFSGPFRLRPMSTRYPAPKQPGEQQQVHNTGPATKAREHAAYSKEKGAR